MLNDVTGLEMKASDLETISRRVLTLERLFNLLCGFTADDDWLSERFFRDPIEVEGRATVCPAEEFLAMRAEYTSRSAGTSGGCRARRRSRSWGSARCWGRGSSSGWRAWRSRGRARAGGSGRVTGEPRVGARRSGSSRSCATRAARSC